MQEFNTGLKLYTFAKDKAKDLGLSNKATKMDKLICGIQEKEGHTPCFRMRSLCNEISCCWQASCGAWMVAE